MKTRSRWFVALGGALGVALTACASQPSARLADLPGTEGCFWTRTVFDWVALDDSTLIAFAPTDRSPYLVKLISPVPGLGAHEHMAFHSGRGGGAQFCSASHAFVTVAGRPGWRQTAVAVRSLTPAVARQLMAEVRLPIVHHAPAIYPRESRAAPPPPPAPTAPAAG